MPYEVGCHFGVPENVYHADCAPSPSLSRSIIKLLVDKTPAHARMAHPRLNPDYKEEQAEKFDIGSAAHALLLQGLDMSVVVDAEDWRTNKAKQARDEARNDGLYPLLKSQYADVKAMVEAAENALYLNEDYPGIKILDGHSEVTYIWQEGETWLRCRTDFRYTKRYNIIIDYKTTGASADPNEYSRLIINNGLDIQDAFYRRGVRAIDGTEPQFVFLVQETSAPYLCSFIALPPQFKAMGEEKVNRGIDLWRHCVKTGEWPGYPKRVCYVEPKPWMLASWQEKQLDIGVNLQGEI
jgi:hypothetical protein